MRIVHRAADRTRVVEIDIDDPARRVAELVHALDPAADPSIAPVIDGARATADSPLSGVALFEVSIVDTSGRSAPTRPPVRTVAVVGGLRAGAAVAATEGLTIGRAPTAGLRIDDPALSGHHLALGDGMIRDLGSRNGSAVDGHWLVGPAPVAPGAVVRAGTTRLRLGAAVDDRPVAVVDGLGARGGTIPFNRPPRILPAVDPDPLECPGPGPTPPVREPLSLAGIVLPIVAGAVVAVLLSPYMAVFAALGPVLTVGTWWERRRRAVKEYRRARSDFDGAVSALGERVLPAREAEIVRRRGLHPDPAEVVRRAEGPSVRLWERRPGHADAFTVAIGGTDQPFDPPLRPLDGDRPAPEAARLLAEAPMMPDVPLPVDLSPGRVIGLVGDRDAALALARGLVLQMATHHGPADLSVVVGADDPVEWTWTAWLPHTADHASGRRGAGLLTTGDGPGAVGVIAGAGDRTILAVLDGDDPFQGRGTVGRVLLAHDGTAAIVLVRDGHRLPARCDTVARVDALGRITVVDPRRADRGRPGLGWGLPAVVAAGAARRLARLDDPELPLIGAGVPGEAPLLGLLGISGDDAAQIEARWERGDGTAELVVPIGADGDGPVVLDVVRDGPHLLIGGTTGSGKSELLRALVAGVAATADPDHVAMVLVDYKGGAAFDCCADLPHVAGLVTDLDASLAARAMRCLEAELRYRECRLREVGADDMSSFRDATAGLDGHEPLPRLLVVVDEFASLAADLPQFVHALVGVAQRGRSLGVHVVLATQRPAGVVTDDIRANAGCRIALRMTDRNDSVDVIDAPDAAAIPRSRPGRAVARFGPGELVPFQAAHVSGISDRGQGLRVRSATPDGAVLATAHADSADGEASTDLARLVGAIGIAHRDRGGRRPRPPWPPPLPEDLCRDGRPGHQWLLVDEPDRQCQRFDGWSLADGHLVVVGGPGSGATTTLAAAALAVAGGPEANGSHLHVIDLDAGGLGPLVDLAATGTMCRPSESVRRQRLMRWMADEVARRRATPQEADPPMLLVVDDLGGLARAHDPVREPTIHEQFARIWAEGPAVGLTVAVSLRRAADLPPALLATAGTVLVHRTADQSEGLRFGLRQATDDFPPGRALRARDSALVQVMRDAPTIAEAVQARATDTPRSPRPHDVGELRPTIAWGDAPPSVAVSAAGADLRFAVADRDLAPALMRLHPKEHALILGPPRSGRTSALVTLARAAGDDVVVVGEELARRSEATAVDPVGITDVLTGRGPTLVLVDDALDVADPTGDWSRLVAGSHPGVHIVAAARPDRCRGAYGHWVAEIRASRVGLLLRPDPLDGDLLGHQLPARLALPPLPGRGVMVGDSTLEVVQVVRPGGDGGPADRDGQSAS